MSGLIDCKIIGLADEAVVDKYNIPVDTIHRTFSVMIVNSKDVLLYPRLVNTIENWTFNGVNQVDLAVVNAHSSNKYSRQIIRTKPEGVLVSDVGYMTVKLYLDAARTVLFDECAFASKIYVVSLPEFTSIQEWSFDDGTNQGWSLIDMSISSVRKYGDSGYSARHSCYFSERAHGLPWRGCYSNPKLSKSVSLPNYTHVFGRCMLWIKACGWHNSGAGSWAARLDYIKIKFDDGVVFQTIEPMYSVAGSGLWNRSGCTPELSWIPLSFNLDTCIGQVGTLSIEFKLSGEGYGLGDYYDGVGGSTEVCVDDIIIGGI